MDEIVLFVCVLEDPLITHATNVLIVGILQMNNLHTSLKRNAGFLDCLKQDIMFIFALRVV
jgi:hypothetical protein